MKKIVPISLVWLAGICLLAAVLFLIPSCSSSKDLSKSSNKVDSTGTTDLQTKITSLQADTAEYRRQLREMEFFGAQLDCPEVDTAALRNVFSKECPPAKIDSVIRAIQPKPTTVRKGADGSIEIISERLRAISYSKTRIEEENKQLRSVLQTYIENSIKQATRVEKKETAKEVHKKSGFMSNLWLLLIIGAIIGVFLVKVMNKYPYKRFVNK